MQLLDTRRTRVDEWLNKRIAEGGYKELSVVTGFLYERGWSSIQAVQGMLAVNIISSVHVDGKTKALLEKNQTLHGAEASHVHYDVRFFDKVTQHAKLFLLTGSDQDKPDIAIIGSSNLTGPGLGVGDKKNLELNYVITDTTNVNDLKAWFQALWNESQTADKVQLLVDESQNVAPKKTYLAQLLPGILTFADLIKTLLDDQKAQFKDYSLAHDERYQRDAIDEMDFRLQYFGCCFLSDDVGLGKTVMGTGMIKRTLARRLREEQKPALSTLVVCPKPVQTQWASHIARMGEELAGDLGLEESLLPYIQIVTYGQERSEIWRRDMSAASVQLVLVDEAHRLRNTTQLYHWLSNLDAELRQQGAKPRYLFLTATPINNSFMDLYNLFRLSLPHSFWAGVGIEQIQDFLRNIDQTFSSHSSDTQKRDVSKLSLALGKIMIRRDVGFLKAHYGAADLARLKIPNVAGEAKLIRGTHSKLGRWAPQIGQYLEKSLFVPYQMSVAYEQMHESRRDEIQTSVSAVLRSHLSKSIQSSFAAGVVSLANITQRCRLILASGERTAIASLEEDFGQDSTDGQIDLDELGMENRIDSAELDRIRESAEADITHLEGFADFLRQHQTECDIEKATSLLACLDNEHPTLIFTEYHATAKWLISFLKQKGIKVFDAAPDVLEKSDELKKELLRLDPSQDSPLRHENPSFSVYVLTDKYSEGRNFHKCRCIINYDLPWNPIRKTQRQGRIVRVGSNHQEVHIYSLSYTHDALNAYADPEALLKEKLAKITAVLGRGHNDDLLTEGENFISYFVRYNRASLGENAQLRVDALGVMDADNISTYFYQVFERIRESGYEQDVAEILFEWQRLRITKDKTFKINDRRKIFAILKTHDGRDSLLWCERDGRETKMLKLEEVFNLPVDRYDIVDRLDDRQHLEHQVRGLDRNVAKLKQELAKMVNDARVKGGVQQQFVAFLNSILHHKPQNFFETMKKRLNPLRTDQKNMIDEINKIMAENLAFGSENRQDTWVVLCTNAYADEESAVDPRTAAS